VAKDPVLCDHKRTILRETTWIRTCLDCKAWRCDDEVGHRGKWRYEHSFLVVSTAPLLRPGVD
jgi:hypothetical protein